MLRATDLTDEESANVRAALRFLRTRLGTWASVARALGCKEKTLEQAVGDRQAITGGLTIRAARVAGVGVDDLLAGRYPPAGMCPTCGHVAQATCARL